MPARKLPPHRPGISSETARAIGLRPPHPSETPGIGRMISAGKNIKSILIDIHNEPAPPALLTAFRTYWPHLKVMTMREAWLRVVYMEAIAGQPWASYFIADRTEGKVAEGGMTNSKGAILTAIDELIKKPVTEGAVV